jgi:hypothetical protein
MAQVGAIVPKRTVHFSGSRDQPAGAEPEASGHSLASLYRLAIAEQLSVLEENSALSNQEKLVTLYGVFQNVVRAINRISDAAPTKAPELWAERDPQTLENIDTFLRRVYGPYQQKGMTMAQLNRIDPHGYRAWYGWKKLPANRDKEYPLPTRSQVVDEALARLEKDISLAELARELPVALRERFRLYGAAANRRYRAKANGPK